MNKSAGIKSLVWSFPVSLFIFAGNMLTVGKSDLFELLFAALVGIFALPVSAVAAACVFGESEKRGAKKVIFIVLSLPVAAASFYVAAETVNDLSAFVGGVMLLRIPELWVSVIFVALCSYLAASGAQAVKKFAFVAFLIVSLSALFLFLLSLGSLKFERIGEIISSAKEISIGGAVNTFSHVFAPAVLAVIYVAASGEKKARASFLGTVMAVILLTVCFLNVFLLLGNSLGSTEDYPYATAVSTVTAGKLFARMEGFAYLMYCAAGVVRASVCIALISLLPEKIMNRKYPFLPYVAGGGVFLVTLLLSLS